MRTGFVAKANLRPGSLGAILLRDAVKDGAHALIWSLFEQQPRGERCFLYREEAPGRFMIVSTVPPEDSSGLWDLEVKPYEPELEEGDELEFILRVNPAVTVKDGDRMRRTDVVMKSKYEMAPGQARRSIDKREILEEWFAPRLAQRGASLERLDLTGWRVDDRARAGGRAHTRAVADLAGGLRVNDPIAFTDLLFDGIGKARAYGCGLMLVRRA